ncbi:MAG: hypothetical protein KA998_03020, partial [Rickettsiaceae bacterium]|nr:hypothetical protein [Rickettsiaceae bacterium]
MFWHSSPVKINISQGFLLDKHKNLSQEGACFGIVVESTRHYLKHSASNNIELQNVTTDLVSMNDEGQRGAKGFKDSILKYFSDLFFSYCFDKNEFDSSDKSWSAKIARKITSDNSRNFAQRIEMYHHLQFTKAFSDLRTLFRLNLKDSKNVSLIDLIFGAANSGFVNESISVDLSLETLNSRHAINIIKEKNGGYLVRDPNSGEFKHTETKERADKVIRDLLISYENINNSFWDLLCGRVNIREFLFEENLDKNLMYCVTPIDKLLKKIGIVDENGIPKSSVEKYAINFNLEGLSESEKEEKLEKFIRIEDAILAEDNEVLKSEFSVSGSEEFT